MLLRCCLIHISIITLRCFIYLLYLCPCLHLSLFMPYLRESVFIFVFIFIMVNCIISWMQLSWGLFAGGISPDTLVNSIHQIHNLLLFWTFLFYINPHMSKLWTDLVFIFKLIHAFNLPPSNQNSLTPQETFVGLKDVFRTS